MSSLMVLLRKKRTQTLLIYLFYKEEIDYGLSKHLTKNIHFYMKVLTVEINKQIKIISNFASLPNYGMTSNTLYLYPISKGHYYYYTLVSLKLSSSSSTVLGGS